MLADMTLLFQPLKDQKGLQKQPKTPEATPNSVKTSEHIENFVYSGSSRSYVSHWLGAAADFGLGWFLF
jgi:hypothetical protein